MKRSTLAVLLTGFFFAVWLMPVVTGRLSVDEGDVEGRVWLRVSSRTASGTSSSAPSAYSSDKPILRRARSGKCFLSTVVVLLRAGVSCFQPEGERSGEEEDIRRFARSHPYGLPIKRAPPDRR